MPLNPNPEQDLVGRLHLRFQVSVPSLGVVVIPEWEYDDIPKAEREAEMRKRVAEMVAENMVVTWL